MTCRVLITKWIVQHISVAIEIYWSGGIGYNGVRADEAVKIRSFILTAVRPSGQVRVSVRALPGEGEVGGQCAGDPAFLAVGQVARLPAPVVRHRCAPRLRSLSVVKEADTDSIPCGLHGQDAHVPCNLCNLCNPRSPCQTVAIEVV
jgi:hypothetical protein